MKVAAAKAAESPDSGWQFLLADYFAVNFFIRV